MLKAQGERKQVTVLFSDLSGYTAMSEKLDPEEVKEIMSRIFGEVAQIVAKYEGYIDKFMGDAVMVLFGVPKSHEDDPVRAVKAATDIHDLVERISPQLEKKIDRPLSMHTGINTGLVVTGEINLEKGTEKVLGDTVNLASRLTSLAKGGEIFVGEETCHQAEGHFNFETLEPAKVKGKTEPIRAYKVVSIKEKPITVHRLSGLRAELIGRKAELFQLKEAVQKLGEGKGTIISICGDAGTGKSRLIEEFKGTLDLNEIQWREGRSYAYSQNIPYFPLIDLLSRAWQIEEGDSQNEVKEKIESNIERLLGKKDVAPYIGGLYGLKYKEIEDVDPEFWKSRLREGVKKILSALTRAGPTIIFLEDIHWADPSTTELLHFILSDFKYPAIFLFTYRLPFNLFASHQLSSIGKIYQGIQLKDLSASEAEEMMESLLKTDNMPPELRTFAQDKAEGNPFYLEEVINSLIESESLIREKGEWKLISPISETTIPLTINGVISARIDRLQAGMKRLLQEASVVGRAFLYEVLKKITELKDQLENCLDNLEMTDLIRKRSLEPDLEYIFKHALTQDVVYNGILKKERQEIHEKIALVIEELFQERLNEFYETLAFHFKHGKSHRKAVDYLMKSGEKSLKRYSVEESHQYYKEAFDLLAKKEDKTKDEESLFIDLLVQWAEAFYYRGDFKGLLNLLKSNKDMLESLDDKTKLGMFYGWMGMALWGREKFKDSYQYLQKALNLGKETNDQHVIGYASAWLSFTAAELGLLDEAITYGERARKITKPFKDHYLYLKSLGGMGYAYWFKGEAKKAHESGKALLDEGHRFSNVRSVVMGYFVTGFSYFADGNFSSAIECSQEGIQASADPYCSLWPKFLLGVSYVQNGNFEEAEGPLREVVGFSRTFGAEAQGTPALLFLGAVLVAKGRMAQGLKMIKDIRQMWLENQRRYCYAISEYLLGNIYLQIVERASPISLSMVAKNIGFLVKNVPFASRKAEAHFNKAIEAAKEIAAKGLEAQAFLGSGLLYKAKKKTGQAKKAILEAISLFEECEAQTFLKQAKETLASLE